LFQTGIFSSGVLQCVCGVLTVLTVLTVLVGGRLLRFHGLLQASDTDARPKNEHWEGWSECFCSWHAPHIMTGSGVIVAIENQPLESEA
jgi:hypothetical protein